MIHFRLARILLDRHGLGMYTSETVAVRNRRVAFAAYGWEKYRASSRLTWLLGAVHCLILPSQIEIFTSAVR